jgi:hypothetical protein
MLGIVVLSIKVEAACDLMVLKVSDVGGCPDRIHSERIEAKMALDVPSLGAWQRAHYMLPLIRNLNQITRAYRVLSTQRAGRIIEIYRPRQRRQIQLVHRIIELRAIPNPVSLVPSLRMREIQQEGMAAIIHNDIPFREISTPWLCTSLSFSRIARLHSHESIFSQPNGRSAALQIP